MPNALRKADPQELAKLGIDPKFLAEVQAHCRMVGNEVVIDRSWWLATVAAAAASGTLDPKRSWLDMAIGVVDIAGNLRRIVHGREHRGKVVARMDKLDGKVEEVRRLVRSGAADEGDVPFMLAQLLDCYIRDIERLWVAYLKRYNRPFADHPDWPC